ncbi:unnamed protein product [Arabis nemorensis]|uniref:Uncharacterized protein n=1 Tax=Arabis nemorensis TaxID=586526 RepID=A0A565AU48_9BRAS|nr:unnamed protein product [Arabis nemorensis]
MNGKYERRNLGKGIMIRVEEKVDQSRQRRSTRKDQDGPRDKEGETTSTKAPSLVRDEEVKISEKKANSSGTFPYTKKPRKRSDQTKFYQSRRKKAKSQGRRMKAIKAEKAKSQERMKKLEIVPSRKGGISRRKK